jgi:hypothetical protein
LGTLIFSLVATTTFPNFINEKNSNGMNIETSGFHSLCNNSMENSDAKMVQLLSNDVLVHISGFATNLNQKYGNPC